MIPEAGDTQTEQYEQQVRAAITADLDQRLDQLTRKLTATYVVVAGGADQPLPPAGQPRLQALLAEELRRLLPHSQRRRLLQSALVGIRLGATRTGIEPAIPLYPRPSGRLVEAIEQADLAAARTLAEAIARAYQVPLRSFGDLAVAIAKARQIKTSLDRTAVWVAHRALNEGAQAVALTVGAQRLWVAERDACLHCLAYAGQVTDAARPFPGGLTYGDRPLSDEPVDGPPLHPWCRCSTQLWTGQLPGYSGQDLPSVLRREAQRSVARYQALGSRPAKLRAIDRLLQHPTLLPKSVQQRARRLVASGGPQ